MPAIAVSQQAADRRHGLSRRRASSTSRSAPRVAARARAQADRSDPLPAGTLLNVNCPAGEVSGIEVARLGKRLYNDELTLVDEEPDGRRRYRIYGFEPSFEDEQGTDLAAVARGRIAITPVHFDLTDHAGLDRLRELGPRWDRSPASLDARRQR